MAPWKLPVLVAAIVVPLVAGTVFAGPALGTALGALAVAAIIVAAVRQRPRGPIGSPHHPGRRRVLVVLTRAVEDPVDIERLIAAGSLDGRDVDVLVLSPARIHFLDRWASDVEGARQDAQRRLVATVAALAKAGIEAEARVGDEDVVQAVEDQLGEFDAGTVVLVGGDGSEAGESAAAKELSRRLRADFHQLSLAGPPSGG